MVHLPLVLTLISNSPRILISRQTIGIEIDNSIAFRYATPPCSPSLYSPVTLSFITSVHYVIMASVPLLPCLLLLLPLMSLWLLLHYVIMASVPYVFFYVKYFYELTNLSRNSKQKIGQYLPFLSRTFREEFVTIKNTIIYKIK